MGLAGNQWLNRFYIDAATARLQFPVGAHMLPVDVECETRERQNRETLKYSLAGLSEAMGSDRVTPLTGGAHWMRAVRFNDRCVGHETIDVSFEHTSGRFLNLEIPVGRSFPTAQRLFFGLRRRGVLARIENYVQLAHESSARFHSELYVKLTSSALTCFGAERPGASNEMSLPKLAIQIASELYQAKGYFLRSDNRCLRLMLSYAGMDQPRIVRLIDDNGGLKSDGLFSLSGLKSLRVDSKEAVSFYMPIHADLEAPSLEITCLASDPSGEQSLTQDPMPGRLWRFIREHTGVGLDQPLS